jgi:hypothetical protein
VAEAPTAPAAAVQSSWPPSSASTASTSTTRGPHRDQQLLWAAVALTADVGAEAADPVVVELAGLSTARRISITCAVELRFASVDLPALSGGFDTLVGYESAPPIRLDDGTLDEAARMFDARVEAGTTGALRQLAVQSGPLGPASAACSAAQFAAGA